MPLWHFIGFIRTVILVANSKGIRLRRRLHENDEGRSLRPRWRNACDPIQQTIQVDACSGGHVLQMGAWLANVPTAPQSAPTYRLGVRPFDSRALVVQLGKFFGSSSLSGRSKRLEFRLRAHRE